MSPALLSAKNDQSFKEVLKLNDIFYKNVDCSSVNKNLQDVAKLANVVLLYLYFLITQRNIFNYARYVYGKPLDLYLEKKRKITQTPMTKDDLKAFYDFLETFKSFVENYQSRCEEFHTMFIPVVSLEYVNLNIASVLYHLENKDIQDILDTDKPFFQEYEWVGNLSLSDVVCLFKSLEQFKNTFVKETLILTLSKKRQENPLLAQKCIEYNNILKKYKKLSEEELDY